MDTMSSKILIIGLDGATFDVIGPMAEKGWLPNISKLMEEGVYGDLHSTVHPITPQAWTTFLTGKNAGKHGIFDFTVRRNGSYAIEFVNASYRNGGSFFRYLSDNGVKTGAIAVPFTYPPEPLSGFMLSGFDAPAEDERSVYPKELYEEIKKNFGNYYIHLASPVGRKNDINKFWEDIAAEDKNRTDISLYLMDTRPCGLFMTTYNNTDRVQHQYLTYEYLDDLKAGSREARENIVSKTYENTDREIGRILSKIDSDTTVILMSDHGSGPIRKVFFLNRWLEENGFLKYKPSKRAGLKYVEKAREMSKRLLPRSVKGFIKSFMPGVRDMVESYRYYSEIDWDNTVAYGFGMYGNIFINLKGREPGGAVAPGDFDQISEKIAEKLSDLCDPETGERLVEKVYRKEELYSGPSAAKAPDLVIKWKDYSYYTSVSPGREKGSCFGKFSKIDSSEFDHVGTHRLNGIFIASGKHIARKKGIEGAKIADIAPTVLFAMDQPVPEGMDGNVLREIFTEDFLADREVRYSSGASGPVSDDRVNYTEGESKEVEERLKGLGYL